MSANKSQNLKLHLWEPEDNFLRTEFNENFAAIDTAVKADRDAIKAEENARKSAVSTEKSAREAADAAEAQAREEVRTLANAANLAASKAQQTADAAWSAKNPGWVLGSYAGDGTTPKVLTLGFRPSALYVVGQYTPLMVYPCPDTGSFKVTWLNDGLSWYYTTYPNDAERCLNQSKRTYYYIAFR